MESPGHLTLCGSFSYLAHTGCHGNPRRHAASIDTVTKTSFKTHAGVFASVAMVTWGHNHGKEKETSESDVFH